MYKNGLSDRQKCITKEYVYNYYLTTYRWTWIRYNEDDSYMYIYVYVRKNMKTNPKRLLPHYKSMDIYTASKALVPQSNLI
jgi:hypothetical protein